MNVKSIMGAVVAMAFASSAIASGANFGEYSNLISKYVKENTTADGSYETSFDYDEALKDPTSRTAIKNQLEVLNAFDVNQLTTREAATAFWINTYNFLMIAKIFKDGTRGSRLKINSVKDMGSLLNPYGAFSDKDFTVGGKVMSLDDVEKGTLLGSDFKKRGWKDARIHFAVNCASVGCPPLIPKIYEAQTLDQQLNENLSKAFKSKRHLSVENGVLRLTSLFDWYKDDFVESAGSVVNFISKHVDNESQRMAIQKAKIGSFITYDWNLNKPGNFK